MSVMDRGSDGQDEIVSQERLGDGWVCRSYTVAEDVRHLNLC